jgi:GH35 family endo-1,4-beta-xylanase
MKTKYYKFTLEGEHSADDAQRALGDAAAQGIVVRVDNVGGQTHLYIAAQGISDTTSGKKAAVAGGVKVEEVSELDVTKIV